MKQPVALLQQSLADGLALIASINHRLEITPQMGPAPLQAFDPPVRLQAVAGSHARVVLAQQALGHRGAATLAM
jgi:hypothetical protein